MMKKAGPCWSTFLLDTLRFAIHPISFNRTSRTCDDLPCKTLKLNLQRVMNVPWRLQRVHSPNLTIINISFSRKNLPKSTHEISIEQLMIYLSFLVRKLALCLERKTPRHKRRKKIMHCSA